MTARTTAAPAPPWGEVLATRPVRDPTSVAALLALLAVIATTAGATAALFAVPFVLVALFLPATVAFLAGQLSLLATFPPTEPTLLLLAQLPLLAVLVEPARDRDADATAASVGTVLVFLALVGVLTSLVDRGLATAGIGLAALVATAVYAVHRYELVRLGLVDAGRDENRQADGEPTGTAADDAPSASMENE